MNKNKIISIGFIAVIFSTAILNVITPSKEFSERENRYLSQFPKFSLETLVNGKFIEDVDEYIADQFVAKDFWVYLKGATEKSIGKKENNNVYFGEEDYLFEKYTGVNSEIIDKNLKGINEFIEKYNIKTTLSVVPNSSEIYPEYLPYFIQSSQEDLFTYISGHVGNSLTFINPTETLMEHKSEYIYYKTDHHYSTLGAYYVYETLGDVLGYTPYKLTDFTIKEVANDFDGTYYSKANDYFLPKDKMYYFLPLKENPVKLYYDFKQSEGDTLYNETYLTKKDKYASFLDSNHTLIEIETSVKNGKSLLIFKDSYAHSLIPFLTEHYENIVVIDLRYFNSSLEDVMSDYEFDEALFLYNANTFNSDSSTYKLKYLK